LELIPYSAKKMAGKAKNRQALCKELGLTVTGPLAILVSRLTPQKGIDLIAAAMPDFIAAGGGLCVLGSGDPELELAMRALAAAYPRQISVKIGYDEGYSHRLFAAGDAVLVPSRFEPCGLTQLYGLAYGTLPLVSNVGGLADTVIHASPAAKNASTGVVFHPVDELGLRGALRQLVHLYDDPKTWAAMQARAMGSDLGWDNAAQRYADLYAGLM